MKRLFGISLLAVAATVGFSSVSKASVWETRAHWSLDYEMKFGAFIAQTPLDIFQRQDTPYGNMPTDCADAAYTLRIIFASQEGLPVNFASSVGPLSNEMRDFDNLPDGPQRIRAFINRVRAKTDTGTLMNETYSIAVNRQSVRPGTMLIRSPTFAAGASSTYQSGHAYIIQSVPANGILRLISSTVPIAVRELMVRNGIVFAPMNKMGGFRAWKWSDSNQRPYASEEQFTFAKWRPDSFRDTQLWWNWQTTVVQHLRTRPSTATEDLNLEVENMNAVLSERARMVTDAWNLYQKRYGGRGCMNDSDYEDYSTPSRDSGIQTEIQYLDVAIRRYAYEVMRRGDSIEARNQMYAKIRFPIDAFGNTISAKEVRDAFIVNKTKVLMISEPEHSPAVRWGFEVLPENQAPCPNRISKYLR